MISRDDFKKARPTIETATVRYVRGEISRVEYERQVAEERKSDRRPPAEQTSSPK